MKTVIFSYRLVSDTGFAPCIDNNTFSLACCKGGQVRKGKNVFTGLRFQIAKYKEQYPHDDIYVLGIYKNKLLYYARVTDVITMLDYYSDINKIMFGKRTDHIYDLKNGVLERNKFLPHIHPKGDLQNERDKNGVYVIISNQFSYFGTSAPLIPKNVLDVLPQFRENKKYFTNESAFNIVNDFIQKSVYYNGVVGKPHQPLKASKSGGCR